MIKTSTTQLQLLIFSCFTFFLVAGSFKNAYSQNTAVVQEHWLSANGGVNTVVQEGSTVYLGGTFTYIGYLVSNGAAVNTSTGLPNMDYVQPNGKVNKVISDGAGGWYIGGTFTQVGGVGRNRLARINADGSLHAWNPNSGGEILALAINSTGTTVYVGGTFTTVGGQSRLNVAALDATTGLATAWNANINTSSVVQALAVDGSSVYVGGLFTTIGGQSRKNLASLDDVDGIASGWDPQPNSNIFSITVSSSTVYVGGPFGIIGGESRANIAALSASTGLATSWNPGASGGFVLAIAVSDNIVYIGGGFNTVGGQPRNRIAAIGAADGIVTAWDPNADNNINGLVVSGSLIYASGNFTSIGGQSRERLAALNISDGLATSWNPSPLGTATISGLAVSGSTIYAGGNFTAIGGARRNRIAAMNTTTGMLTSWNPDADGGVHALTLSGSTIYVGGAFTTIGGEVRNRIAALSTSTGLATTWNPNASSAVRAIAVSGSTIYAGGDFSIIGGQNRDFIAAIDATSGLATAWNPSASGPLQALATSGSIVYAGGTFTTIGGMGRNNVAALDATSGLATSWDPNANNTLRSLAISGNTIYMGGMFSMIGGEIRSSIAAVDATSGVPTSWDPNANSTVNAIAVSESTVYAGGFFTNIGGQPRNRIAALDATSGLATAWDANAGSYVNAVTANETMVYAGGNFTSMAGKPRGRIAAITAHTTTTVTWTGSTDSNGGNASNWSGGMPPAGSDIVIPEGATPYPVFSANMSLGNITIEPNATLTMAPSFRLEITEDSNITIGAGGKLILKSDGTGTAYIGSLTGTSAITGTVMQERYIMGSNRSFRFMGHPFNTAIPLSALGDKIDITGPGAGFTPSSTNSPSAFYYDPSTGDADTEEDGGWKAFTAMDDSWNRHQGIRVLVRGTKGQAGSFDDAEYTPNPVTFEWEGSVNTGLQTINLGFHTPSGGVSDFNLVGNPFPSAIDLKAITRSASVGGSFYIWQPRESTSGMAGRGGAYLTEPFAAGSLTYTLPTGGAFFVRAGAAGQTLTIEEADKVNSNEPLQSVAGSTLRMDSNLASKYGSNSIQVVLSSQGEWWDRSLIFFDGNTTNTSQDKEDATKMANPEVNFFTVSADDYAMAIDARPYQEATGAETETNNNRIPLHILSPARAYTLSLPDFDIEEGRTLRLYDRFTEKYITLQKGTSYDFTVTADPKSKGHRFDIVMGIEVITSINSSNNRFQAFILPNPAQEQVRISIQKPDNVATTHVRIVSMSGTEVRSEQVSAETTELDINLSQLRKGIYLVEITHGTERIVKRLIVN